MLLECPSCSKQIESDVGNHLPPWCPQCGADLKNRPEATEKASGDGPKCFACEATAEHTCSRCGDVFCFRHGGYRAVWTRMPMRGYRIRDQLVCDDCTPNNAWMKFTIAAAVLFLIAASISATYFYSSMLKP